MSTRATVTDTFEQISAKEVYPGIKLNITIEEFRYPDGTIVTREIAELGDSVAVLAVDGEDLILIRQPREAGGQGRMLEVVAGGVEAGEDPAQAAARELAEEIGKKPGALTHLRSFQMTPGVLYEEMHLYLATELEDTTDGVPDPDERIEIVRWPLHDLTGAIDACRDAKTLIALHELRASAS